MEIVQSYQWSFGLGEVLRRGTWKRVVCYRLSRQSNQSKCTICFNLFSNVLEYKINEIAFILLIQ